MTRQVYEYAAIDMRSESEVSGEAAGAGSSFRANPDLLLPPTAVKKNNNYLSSSVVP